MYTKFPFGVDVVVDGDGDDDDSDDDVAVDVVSAVCFLADNRPLYTELPLLAQLVGFSPLFSVF